MSSKYRRSSPLTARRGPSGWMVASVVLVVVFAGAVGFGVYRAHHTPGRAAEVVIPAGATATGVTLGRADAPAEIEVYLDLQCPHCKQFEVNSGPTIDQLVASGRAKVTYHPMAFLDDMSSNNYSSRASAATGCASDAGVYAPFLALLFRHQPPENSDGPSDDQIIELGRQAGADDRFAGCVRDHRYAAWTAALTEQASRAGVHSTPTVLVDGHEIGPTDASLRAAVESASR